MPNRLYDPRLATLGLFLDCGETMMEAAASIYKERGLRRREVTVLYRIVRAREEGLQMKELARLTGTSTSGITTVVDSLERRGLVTRRLAENDRRSWSVHLTDEGRTVFNVIIDELLPALEVVFFEPLGDDLEAFNSMLTRLADALHTRVGGDGPDLLQLP